MPNWKSFFMGRGFFVFLALFFLALTTLFVVSHSLFVFRELTDSFTIESGEDALPEFDIESFQKLNLFRK
mgnify:FL=1